MILVKCYNILILISGLWSLQLQLFPTNSTAELPRFIEYLELENNYTRIINMLVKPYTRALTKDPNRYRLYTRDNPDVPQELSTDNLDSVTASSYNSADQTVFILHDWDGNWQSKLNPTIRDAFLSVIYANIIVVDWSSVVSSEYVVATSIAPRVGKFLGQFVRFLYNGVGASYGTMHLVGFGVGAHIAGNAGHYLKPDGQVARITGLDPAGPMWDNNPNRLKEEDALYVEVIHTDSSLLGTSLQCGAVDFYPNGGARQPGCSSNVSDSCNHMRSWEMFAATIRFNHLVGRRCLTAAAFGFNMCYQQYLPMGSDDLLKNKQGVYRLTTGGKYPYPQIF